MIFGLAGRLVGVALGGFGVPTAWDGMVSGAYMGFYKVQHCQSLIYELEDVRLLCWYLDLSGYILAICNIRVIKSTAASSEGCCKFSLAFHGHSSIEIPSHVWDSTNLFFP